MSHPEPQEENGASVSQRDRSFLWRVALYWFAYPLGFGIVGMLVSFMIAPLPIPVKNVDPLIVNVVVLSLSGVGLGAFAATVHSIARYVITYRPHSAPEANS